MQARVLRKSRILNTPTATSRILTTVAHPMCGSLDPGRADHECKGGQKWHQRREFRWLDLTCNPARMYLSGKILRRRQFPHGHRNRWPRSHGGQCYAVWSLRFRSADRPVTREGYADRPPDEL